MKFLPVTLLAALAACGSTPAPTFCDGGAILTFNDSCALVTNAITSNPSCEDAGIVGEAPGCPGLLQQAPCQTASQYCAAGIDSLVSSIQATACGSISSLTFSVVCQ